MGTMVADCFRLASRGGPVNEPHRGMTLALETSYLDAVMARLSKIDSLVESQEAIIERSMRVYGPKSKGLHNDKETLEKLKVIQSQSGGLTRKQIAHLVLDVLVDYECEIGP